MKIFFQAKLDRVLYYINLSKYSGAYVKQPLSKRPKIGLLLNAGQKYCSRENSAILLTFIKLPVDIKTFVFSIFK